ncbi:MULTISPECIES: CHASE2 domain-containing protein [Methylomonas]|uniref:CHASE2 domain-containing protein n=1 Tax=Methylomonas TaxID=416 RepID=UPI0022B24507|nr:adenylate/guanylate cyclase domain-containing protein [Methylomonas koyamae]
MRFFNEKYIRTVFFISFLSFAVSLLHDFDESLGIVSLLKYRGLLSSPGEVVLVAMDETSEAELGVGNDLTRWRRYHAGLIRELHRQGVALVVFDLQFIRADPEVDSDLADAMREAGNVLASDCIQMFRRATEDFFGREECSESNKDSALSKNGGAGGELAEPLVALRRISANPQLQPALLGHAPFVLANDAEDATIRETWLYLDGLGEMPSLPVVAWAAYLDRMQGFEQSKPWDASYMDWLAELRRTCLAANGDRASQKVDQRLAGIVCGEESRFINFYGPPQTLRMESYSQVLQGKVADLRGKVVFVGKANRQYAAGKTDFFQTPLTDARTGKMAGVEIMATVFANLLEDRFIRTPLAHGAVYAGFALMLALLLSVLPAWTGYAATALFTVSYVLIALWLFARHAVWLPIMTPAFVMLPTAWLTSLVMARRELLIERRRMLAFVRRVFPQWAGTLPFAESGNRKATFAAMTHREIRGVCLATDIEGYTSLAAGRSAEQMWELLNAYYQVLGRPVGARGGAVADVTGDSMMAVWFELSESERHTAACLAALDMQAAVMQFNQTSGLEPIRTRIGLYVGEMILGGLESGQANHYRAIGDTVNTASRIQGINKFLGTQILACRELVDTTAIAYRAVGRFRVVGRAEPVDLAEIVAPEMGPIDGGFAVALSAFQRGDWQVAIEGFQSVLKRGTDGPANFYLALAQGYQNQPPIDWDGVVTLDAK